MTEPKLKRMATKTKEREGPDNIRLSSKATAFFKKIHIKTAKEEFCDIRKATEVAFINFRKTKFS